MLRKKPLARIRYDKHEASQALAQALIQLLPSDREVTVFCVGTDRSTGDALGPLVGMFLQDRGLPNIKGTLNKPIHAVNLLEAKAELDKSHFILAIDSSLGKSTQVGKLTLWNHPLRPGVGVNKDLGKVGDASLLGCVNTGGFMEYFVLQNTRLSLVMRMARVVAEGVEMALVERVEKVGKWSEVACSGKTSPALSVGRK